MSDTGRRVSRIYSNFRGVDFRGEEVNLSRSPDALNMWKDYTKTESIRTRPGYTSIGLDSGKKYGIFFYKGHMYVHSGTNLNKYAAAMDSFETISSNMAEAKSTFFVYDDKLYIMDGTNFFVWNDLSFSDISNSAYAPTTTIARKPMGGGTKHEDVNMLCDYRYNTFLATGVDFDYYLDVVNISSDFVPWVWVNDVRLDTSEYTVDYAEGKIVFKTTPPDAPMTDGQDNVKIFFKKVVPGYKESIKGCTIAQIFDNRVFVSGNPKYPNMVWHCSLNDPTYFSDLDYYKEGMDEAAVKGMVAGNNALWVFREPSDENTTVFYHTPTIDEEYGKIYPSSHSTVSIGCVGKAVNFNDDIVFFSSRGMEGISGDITTEQVVSHRSILVDSKLTAEKNYKNMLLAEWKGYLLVFIDNKVYLADSRAMLQVENHFEYEWFYWELDQSVNAVYVGHDTLYFACGSNLYKMNNERVETTAVSTTIAAKTYTLKKAYTVIGSMRQPLVFNIGGRGFFEIVLKEENNYFGVCNNVGDDNSVQLTAGTQIVITEAQEVEKEFAEWFADNMTPSARNGDSIPCHWVTPKDKFNQPHMLKTTNKRGCITEGTGDISVFVKTEKTSFEHIGTNRSVTDYFSSRIKRKKWKDIQLKFYSQTGFSLESVTLEAYVGGYIKR